jgi:hypothetical protein
VLTRPAQQYPGGIVAPLSPLADLDDALLGLAHQRSTWLQNVHARLDATVFTAYGWSPDISDEEILKNLLALNLELSGEEG